MTWRFENSKQQEAIVHAGMIALNTMVAAASTILAVYHLL